MRIGEAAAAAGTTTKALRFYEARGLLTAVERTGPGYRDYTPDALARLEFITRGKRAGLSLTQIGTVLRLRDDGVTPCTHIGSELQQQLSELEQQIAELEALRATVAEQLRVVLEADRAACDPARICSFL